MATYDFGGSFSGAGSSSSSEGGFDAKGLSQAITSLQGEQDKTPAQNDRAAQITAEARRRIRRQSTDANNKLVLL